MIGHTNFTYTDANANSELFMKLRLLMERRPLRSQAQGAGGANMILEPQSYSFGCNDSIIITQLAKGDWSRI